MIDPAYRGVKPGRPTGTAERSDKEVLTLKVTT
jgi:hypothetical protein